MNNYNILDFGAKASSENLQTEAIQKAIDTCFSAGGGTVIIPKGVFLTGGIRLRSNVNLHLKDGAVLKGSRNPEDYFGYLNDEVEPLPKELVTDCPWSRAEIAEDLDEAYRFMRVAGSRWNNGLIRAINAENIKISGEGNSIIDGSNCFDELGEENYRGPHCISMFYCKNVAFENYVVTDSANWAHSAFFSENISMNNVTINAGHDGVHFTVCKNINIENCGFYTGDDCVSGFANVNVFVNNCELNSACSAFRFGGTNVFIENCHMFGPCKYVFRGSMTTEEKKSGGRPKLEGHRTNMLSAFTYYSDYSFEIKQAPSNIVFKNCVIDNADEFIHYNFSGNEMWQANRPLESVKFENVKVNGIIHPLYLYGDAINKVLFEVKNCEFSIREGAKTKEFIRCANYSKIEFSNVKISNFKGECLFKTWSEDEKNIIFSNLECGKNFDDYIKKAEDKFECVAI